MTTPNAFRADKELVWGWYEWLRMKVARAVPNPAHLTIAELAWQVPKLTVITQNVDDLHERAGSADVIHLHGSLHAPRCFACSRPHHHRPAIPAFSDIPEAGCRLRPPRCAHCGGFVRPGVVWFEEAVPVKESQQAFAAARQCDVLLSVGTSGLVQPAAQIPLRAKQAGANLVQVNPMRTELDSQCDWVLCGRAGEVMPRLLHAAFAPNLRSC